MPCPFCDFSQVRPQLLARVDGFFVLADLHPLVPNHSLLIPETHLACFGALPAALDGAYALVRRRLARFLEQESGQPLYFEHGVAGQTVHHAHLHALTVPRSLALRQRLATLGAPRRIPDLPSLRAFYAANGPYLYVEEDGRAEAVALHRLAPGYLQRVVRTLLGSSPVPATDPAILRERWNALPETGEP